MLQNSNDPRWVQILKSSSDLSKASLATRLLVSRLRKEVAAAPGSEVGKAQELFAWVAKNQFAHADLAHF
ncbi:MAG: hypothetical protein MRY63_07825 [Neomegalonema sp.]|nr:hypothetical protein [Neomegalonema sp.]